MPPFEPRPAIPLERATPTARGLPSWPALTIGLALVLDAVRPLAPGAGVLKVLWLDLGAIVCLTWAVLGPRRAKRTEWATPIDGCVVSGLVLAVLHVVRLQGALEPVLWLRQIAAAALCYYALAARLRRDPRAADSMWPVFAAVLLALSGFAIGRAALGGAARRTRVLLFDT